MKPKRPLLNKYLQPVGSPIDSIPAPKQVPWEYGIRQGIQVKKIRSSHQEISQFQQQISGVFASGTIGNGGTLFLSSTLTPSAPHRSEPVYAVPYAGIFLGTSATTNGQLYPNLGTAAGTAFPLQAGLDYWTFDGTQPTWRGWIINNSGGAATIGINVTWQYIWFNKGTTAL